MVYKLKTQQAQQDADILVADLWHCSVLWDFRPLDLSKSVGQTPRSKILVGMFLVIFPRLSPGMFWKGIGLRGDRDLQIYSSSCTRAVEPLRRLGKALSLPVSHQIPTHRIERVSGDARPSRASPVPPHVLSREPDHVPRTARGRA